MTRQETHTTAHSDKIPKVNTLRAVRGMSAIHSNRRYEKSVNTLGDLLLDLMHHALRDGVDFQKELEWAQRAFVEDTQ